MKIKKRYKRIIEKWILNGIKKEDEIETTRLTDWGFGNYFEVIKRLKGETKERYYSVLESPFGKSYRYWLNNINIFSLIGTLKIRGLENRLKREIDKRVKG